jgi:hypothetical protein
MIWPLAMPTRKPVVVGVLLVQWVELVMRVLVQPESRTAFSQKEGTRGLVVI